MSDALTTAAVAVGSSLLTIFVTPRVQHQFWAYQRRDELRLNAISEYTRHYNAYIAACLIPDEPRPPLSTWLSSINIAGDTIRVLFSDDVYQAARKTSDMVTPYAAEDALTVAEKKKRADDFSDVFHEALTALYREVIPQKSMWASWLQLLDPRRSKAK